MLTFGALRGRSLQGSGGSFYAPRKVSLGHAALLKRGVVRILYLVNGICGSGGLERVLTQKASFLAEEYGHSVHILVLNEAPGAPFYPISHTVGIGHFSATGRGFGYLKAYLRGVRQALVEFQPDVLALCKYW